MKFTKEELSESLKERLTNGGKKNLSLSERSFNGKVERLYARLEKSKDNEDFSLDGVVTDYFEDFQEDDNNIRNDNSLFVREWKEKHRDVGQQSQAVDKSDVTNSVDEKLNLMFNEIEQIKKERDAYRREREISDKRSRIKESLKSKNVTNEDWIDDQLSYIKIDAETDVNDMSERLVKSFNRFGSSTSNNATPLASTGSNGDGNTQKLDKIKKMREEQLKREKDGV